MKRLFQLHPYVLAGFSMMGLLVHGGCSGSDEAITLTASGGSAARPSSAVTSGGTVASGGTAAAGYGATASTAIGGTSGGAVATGATQATGGAPMGPAGTTAAGGGEAAGGAATATGGTTAAGGGEATGGVAAATGGATAAGGGEATGGVAAATGGATAAGGGEASGGVAAATGGATASGGGEATGGASAGTGGNATTGGTGTTGGSTGVGGTTSDCGSTSPNQNPFGCDFAWGVSDPGGSPSSYDFLQFMTAWIDWSITADGAVPTCNGCNWLEDYVASISSVPVYYGYLIGYFAHANGIVDGNQCPADNPDCPNLTNAGAEFIKTHRDTIIQAYADYAARSYAVWPTRPLVWLLEGDFIQFTESSQSSPFTMAELAQLAADINCAIKDNMPNAVVAINHSTWNLNEETDDYWNAMSAVNYDLAWTTGVATNNGYFNPDVNAQSYNGATATYAYLHQVSGKKILVDDGCGGEADEDWSTSSAATLNSLISAGVVAFNHCGTLKSTYQSLTAALAPQLNSTCD